MPGQAEAQMAGRQKCRMLEHSMHGVAKQKAFAEMLVKAGQIPLQLQSVTTVPGQVAPYLL